MRRLAVFGVRPLARRNAVPQEPVPARCPSARDQAEAKMACFSYIEVWYNPARLNSGLGYRSPMTYETTCKQSPPTNSP
jgi:hypothetical protein